ncbi:hypothetical protein ACQP10_04840 [Streptosporangium sandarakinum]|uniref:hypothetical protein n=1 Tax=Streptosporangium TaxID=2000 RepID=UPI0031F83D05
MRGGSRTVAAALGAVALVLAVVTWVVYGDLSRLRQEEADGREALAAARLAAPDMLSYDYRTIEQDFTRAAGYTAGGLTEHYRQLAKSLAPQVRQERTVQQVTVAGAAVESVRAGRVDVLLFTNVGTVRTPPGESEPRRQVIQNRARLGMVKQGSRWLVAELSTLLGTPPPA